MKIPSKRALALVLGLITAVPAFATFREYANKYISHVFTDPAAWNPAGTPVAGDSLQIAALDASSTTWVTNDYTDPLIHLEVKGGSRTVGNNYALTFCTSNTVTGAPTKFRMPDLASDSAYVYGGMAFEAYENANYVIFDMVIPDTRKGPLAFDGVNLQLANSNGACIAKFNAGVFNFGDPNGAANGATLRIGGASSDVAHPRYLRFYPGTTLRYDKALLANGSTAAFAANNVYFDGATATGLSWFRMNQGVCNVYGGTTFTVPSLALIAGAFNVSGSTTSVSVDALAGSATYSSELNLADGATMTVSENDAELGLCALSVKDGAKFLENYGKLTVGAPANLVSGAGAFVRTEKALTVCKNAKLVITNGASASASPVDFSGINATYVVGAGSSLTNRTAEMSFGSGYAGNPQAIYVNGGVFYSGGKITMNEASLIEVNNGGKAYLQTWSSDNLMMGWGGVSNAIVRVNDGYAETYRVRMGRDPSARSYSRIEVNGGRFKATGYINFHQSTTAGAGLCELVINGGVLETTNIDAGDTGKLNDFTDATVHADLTGDGGTLRALGNRGTAALPFIEAMRHTYCGDKGLTLDTQGYTIYFNHNLENKAGEDGLFRKVGSGTLILLTNAWATTKMDVKRIEAAKGTLKMGADMELDETTFAVTNGATLSLAGAAKALTMKGLVVTNGVIALDPGDVLTVDGPLSLSNFTLSYTTTPTATEAQTFLVAQGELSAETQREILRAVYAIPFATGYHGECEFSYDGETGKTTVGIKKAASVPLSESVTWKATSDGAWSTAANWEGGVPTQSKIAVFNDQAEGKATTAGNALAGALSFESGTHVVDGTGLQLASTPGSAFINVGGGQHAITAPLTLWGATPVTIADGATLSLGAVNDASLEKRDFGHLVLDGKLALKGKLVSQDGLVTATNAAAMTATTAEAIDFKAGTFEPADADGEPMRVEATFNVAGTTIRTGIVFKVDSDVTFADFQQTAGNIVKYGPGKMTIEVPANTTKTIIGSNSGTIGYSGAPGLAENGFLYKENGVQPEGWMTKLTMLEGELVLKGLGDKAKAVVLGHSCIGGPCRSPVAVQPMLTVDGCYAQFEDFHNGYELMDNAAYKVKHPCVRVINGGTISINAVQPAAYSCTHDGTDVTFAITNGTLKYANGTVRLSRSDHSRGAPLVRYFLNQANLILADKACLAGSLYVDIDNGSYFGKADGVPTTFTNTDPTRIYGEIFTHNGSKLALASYDESTSQNHTLTFAFDNGEWVWSKTGATATWPASVKGYTVIEMRGTGVILKPAADQTFTTLAPFTGTGGMVVDGPGTVKFGAANTYAFSGLCNVKQGTVDMTANGQLETATFAGSGTVKGAEVTRATVASNLDDDWQPASCPVFDGCEFGTLVIDAGRTSENPLVLPEDKQPIAIAKYIGATKPQRILFRNAGARNVSAQFSWGQDGTLYMTPSSPRGLLITIR